MNEKELSNTMKEELYQNFCLYRTYGTPSQSNIAILPTDVTKQIAPYLSQQIVTDYEQRLLSYKKLSGLLTTKPFPYSKQKPFLSHDGTYNIVLEGKNYAMWDYYKEHLSFYTQKNSDIVLMHESPYSSVMLSLPFDDNFNHTNDINVLMESFQTNSTTTNNISTKTNITHYLLSSDSEWLALGTASPGVLSFYDLRASLNRTEVPNFNCVALCSAHHSPLFAVCNKDGKLLIADPANSDFWSINTINHPTFLQFSHDDKYLLSYGEKNSTVFTVDHKKKQLKYETITMPSPIKKTLFSPDGTHVIIALKDGNLIWWDFISNNVTLDPINPIKWRHKIMPTANDQGPLMLLSKKNNLLILLDSHATNNKIDTLIIRDATTGRKLASLDHAHPAPIAMGLTKDEQSIIVVDETNKAYQIDLYNDEDIENIDFIEHKASLLELCSLWQICKNKDLQASSYEDSVDLEAKEFIATMQSHLTAYKRSRPKDLKTLLTIYANPRSKDLTTSL
jgi:hypothetical protein